MKKNGYFVQKIILFFPTFNKIILNCRWEEESMKENKLKGIKIDQADKPIISRDNINVLLESNRENLYSNTNYDSGGLGFRASLPKMPSFRRKKIPSPVPEDEDDVQKVSSDNEEIVHYPDTDANRPPPRERKDSTSSNGSSSSFSSSSDSDSSDESSSETDEEIKQINRRSITPTIQDSKMEIDSEDIDTFDTFSPLQTGIEPSNKTPEPMQVRLHTLII